jgi:tricorn protease
LGVGTAGSLLALSFPNRATGTDFAPGGGTLTRFSFTDRKAAQLGTGVFGFQTTADGTKMLVNGAAGSQIVPTSAPFSPGQGALNLGTLNHRIDPRTECANMFREAVRSQKQLFYDPGIHGVDLDALAKKYEPLLPHLKTRSQLNEIFIDLFGEICVGHMFIGGGDIPSRPSQPGGLLGADYTFENGRYRLARVYNGERWNPTLFGPLAQPGLEAKAGEYLLAIDGKELTDVMDLYLALEGKAGRQVKVKVGPTPDGAGAREAVVLPIANESQLRFRAWTEDNRRRVLEATGGRVGYVHVPDTATGGWREFMRYYYAQSGMDAVIIDERFNGGGSIADFLVREMTKDIVSFSRTRYGEDYVIPTMGIYGPKVMIANEMAGSGGDILPWLFRFHKVGPIVGKRTWGAMISNYGFGLPDGGRISSPDDAMYDPNGKWIIENVGTPPDIEVELDPFLWRQGKDAQLERAIEEIKKLLQKNPPRRPARPNYPSIPPFRPDGLG